VFNLYQSHEVQLMLADLPPEERKRVWRSAFRAAEQTLLRLAIVIVFGTCLFVWGHIKDRRFGAIVAAVFAATLLTNFWIGRWQTTGFVRRELALIGRCAGCGYDLRETKGTCPSAERRCDSPLV